MRQTPFAVNQAIHWQMFARPFETDRTGRKSNEKNRARKQPDRHYPKYEKPLLAARKKGNSLRFEI